MCGKYLNVACCYLLNRPLDINLYQAQKAIENTKFAVNEGRVLILVASCHEGIGPSNFYNLLTYSKNPEEIIEYAKKNYKLGYHKAVKFVETMGRCEILAVTELQSEILERINIKSFNNIESALNYSYEKLGRDIQVLVVMNAAVTVPITKY